MKMMMRILYYLFIVCLSLGWGDAALAQQRTWIASTVKLPDTSRKNRHYISNAAPLLSQPFIKLPTGAITPNGWLKRMLLLQKNGLTGHLDEISVWLGRKDNTWLNKDGIGKYGWEELPYWLKGYGDIAYVLKDTAMLANVRFWIEHVLKNQRPNGDFGPNVVKNGSRDLWTNMPMLWCLQSYYDYSHDARVLVFFDKYFRWELSLPEEKFLEDYWENSRGGDNLLSVYWLYNRTQAPYLLELARKIDRNTADWRQTNNLPNWHNVNIAECFREPATFYLQSHHPADLAATYHDFKYIRELYGQVPGGMFGADENARKGYDDPRQAVETCGMVEQMTSDQWLLANTGDPFWGDNCEDVAFNMFPASFTPDYKALRYLTAPNMVLNDGKDHHPGIANAGPFLMMNPFSSRCCQHNHAAGWVYYIENSWMATADNGLAAQLYGPCTVRATVSDGKEVTLETDTHYPFDGDIAYTLKTSQSMAFPLYFRVPAWCTAPQIFINGRPVKQIPEGSKGYIKMEGIWKNGDRIRIYFPMQITVRTWDRNKNSISVNYGPLTYALKIREDYVAGDNATTAVEDAKWLPTADPSKWPSYEIHPGSAWNYGLLLDPVAPEKSFVLIRKPWPKDDNPFVNNNTPIEIKARGKRIPDWGIDQYGLCDTLPESPVRTETATEQLTLVPMGGARLRIAAFPSIKRN